MTSTVLLANMIDRFGAPFFPLMGMGEDMTFCFRARQAGFKLYCDSRVKIGHIGQKIYDEDSYILQKLALEQYEKAKRSVKHERT